MGLGADGLSSSCYGPEETFRTLGANPHLALFVALASVVTIIAICASYSQIISLFPTGGGGYLVASKLLFPAAGVVSGSALLIDYVLTITISVASGADALFSLLPSTLIEYRLPFAFAGVAGLTLLNLRGVRESVLLCVPVFFVFIATHAFAILYALVSHASRLGLHTALHVPRLFGDTFKNFVFVYVGAVDAGKFKGAAELAALPAHTAAEAERYAAWARAHGYGAATFTTIGHDTTGELLALAATAREQFPNSVFFAGQLQFVREPRLTRLLHNHTATALQHRFFAENLPFVVLPIRVG